MLSLSQVVYNWGHDSNEIIAVGNISVMSSTDANSQRIILSYTIVFWQYQSTPTTTLTPMKVTPIF